MKWLWAAYRRGVFKGDGQFPEGLDVFQFQTAVLTLLKGLFENAGEAWVFIGKTPRGEIPIGLLVARPGDHKHMNPYVFWFPEASPRNKLECALKWLIDFKSEWRIFIWSRQPSWKFFDHLCKYGVLRPVGKSKDCFDPDEDAMLYQSVRKT